MQDIASPAELETVGLALIPAQWGVAENGAVWVSEKDSLFRVLPFIAQHLIVVLAKDRIVSNMHEAYQRVQIDETGFGVFIAGPSKTADIEQALVIGAQGARSFTVVLE
ncbi:MAG: LUD domain-containing protein [Haliscomenobacter sp.]|nr:LUD domain-containing protein [Haliscomenobacter sp.]